MNGDTSKAVMTNGSQVLTIVIVIKTTKGALFCVRYKHRGMTVAGVNTELVKSMSIDNAHWLLGHANKEGTRAMALRLVWHICIGKMILCEQYAIAKAKQNNVNKGYSARKTAQPNKMWSHHIASIKPPKQIGSRVACPNWHIMVNKYSGVKVSASFPRKNDLI